MEKAKAYDLAAIVTVLGLVSAGIVAHMTLRADVDRLGEDCKRVVEDAKEAADAVVKRAEENMMASTYKSAPLGTIVLSSLPLSQFLHEGGSVDRLDFSILQWAPCDGSDIRGSKLAKDRGVQKAPDLRGIFLRGFNRFSEFETEPVSKEQWNPEEVPAGQLQAGQVGEHVYDGHYAAGIVDNFAPSSPHYRADIGTARTPYTVGAGLENRPKNKSVYYYIRVN